MYLPHQVPPNEICLIAYLLILFYFIFETPRKHNFALTKMHSLESKHSSHADLWYFTAVSLIHRYLGSKFGI